MIEKRKKFTYEGIVEFFNEESNLTECTLLTPKEEYVNAQEYMDFKCNCGNDFKAKFSIMRFYNRYWCKKCSFRKRSELKEKETNTKILAEAKEYNQNFLYIEGVGEKRHFWFECECDKKYRRRVDHLLGFDYWGCNICKNGNASGAGYTTEEIAEIIESNSESKLLRRLNPNNSKGLILQCKCTNEYETTLNRFLSGVTQKCRDCTGFTLWDLEKMKEWISANTEFSLLSEAYLGTNFKHKFKCSCNFEFEMTWGLLLTRKYKKCQTCRGSISAAEKGTFDFLHANNLSFVAEKQINDSMDLIGCRFDYEIEGKIRVELDGEHHFYPINYDSLSEEELELFWLRQMERDIDKNLYCLSKDIPLVRIPYWKFSNIETILRMVLNKYGILNIEVKDNDISQYIVDQGWSQIEYQRRDSSSKAQEARKIMQKRNDYLYKLKSKENVNVFDPIKSVFQNKGISEEDMKWFLNPTAFSHDASLIENMDKGVDFLLEHIKNDNQIEIIVDGDIDGYSSAAILIGYLRKTFPEFSKNKLRYHLHSPDIKHGIETDLVPNDTKLLIVPDAGSGEYEKHDELAKRGIEILILDHHSAPHYSDNALVVNSTMSESYPTEALSGAGVVYRFIEKLDQKLQLNNASQFQALASIGLIGDAMPMSDKEARWLVNQGLENINNDFLNEMIKSTLDEKVRLSPTVISYKILPLINALLRVGTQQEKEELMLALLDHKETSINPKLRKANKEEQWHQRVARLCRNAYGRQRRLRDKIVEELKIQIEEEDLNNNRFLVVEIKGEFELSMSGYIASMLTNQYRKPVMVLRKDKDGLLVGSCRGYDSLMITTKSFINKLNLFNLAAGHEQAFGLQIDRDKFKLLNESINKALEETELQEGYLVDLILPANSMDKKLVNEFEKYSHIWGKNIEPPVIAVEKVEFNLSDMLLMGKTGDMMKQTVNGISYIKFNNIGSLLDLKNDGKNAVVNVVGKTGINHWRGNAEPQFIIDSLEIVEVKDQVRFVF